jgi:hypothetical protein
MQENITQTPIQKDTLPLKSWKWGILLSLAILIIVIASSTVLFILSWMSERSIGNLSKEIESTKTEISKIEADRFMKIARILRESEIRPSLDINLLVTLFREAAKNARVEFQGFSVNRDTIKTTLIAKEGDPEIHPDPITTIIKMMDAYEKGTGMRFTLSPITSVVGDISSRTTPIELTLKTK